MADHLHLTLFHGFMCNADLWRDMANDLASLGTLHYADQASDPDLDGMAVRADAAAGEARLLIGFSMGGYVARRVALKTPEKARGLVLIASSARGDAPERRRRNRLALDAGPVATFRGVPRRALERALHPARRGDTTLIDRLQAMSLDLGQAVFRSQLAIERDDEHDMLAKITCPALIVAGADDGLRSREEAEELRDGLPDAELAILGDCGHMAPVEKPRELFGLIRDWADRRLGG
ncbi:MAG: alpha/beta fold hydrolase [Rhodospirillales bacterium]